MVSLSIASQSRLLVSGPSDADTATLGASLLVIDPGVADYSLLAAAALPGVRVYLLDAQADGIAQITQILQALPTLRHLHILAHGAPGQLRLGNGDLNLDNLDTYATALATWFQSDQAELLIYGCNVAAGDAGTEFLEKLHHLTGATLAASTRPIGKGTWNLNARAYSGVSPLRPTSHSPLPLSPAVLAAYPHTLATFTVDIAVDEDDGNYSAGNLSLREASNSQYGETLFRPWERQYCDDI